LFSKALSLNQRQGGIDSQLTGYFLFCHSTPRSFQMNQSAVIATAAASLMSLALMAGPAAAAEKEKCFGIAKAGQNDCASISGVHSCAGQSKVDMDKGEWKYVAKGTCKDMKGLSMDEAKAMMKKS
jgi:uncharacterized membrane protein